MSNINRLIPLPDIILPKQEERFWARVEKDPESDCWIWVGCHNYGRPRVGLNEYVYLVARIMYYLWYKVNVDDKLVLHTCNNGWCVNPKHLYLGTQTENMKDRFIDGENYNGENNSRHKLTERQVLKIRELQGELSGPEVADKFGVSKGCIYNIWARRRWIHI